MSEKDKSVNPLLKASIGYFLAWIIVALLLFKEYKTNGEVDFIMKSVIEGNYFPLALLAISVLLFAFFIKNISNFLKSSNHH